MPRFKAEGGNSSNPDNLDNSSLNPMWTQADWIATPASAGEGADGFEIVTGGSPAANGSYLSRDSKGGAGSLVVYADFDTSVNNCGMLLQLGTSINYNYRMYHSRNGGNWTTKSIFYNGATEYVVSGGSETTHGQSGIWLMMTWSETDIVFWYNLGAESAEPPTTSWVQHGAERQRFPLTMLNGGIKEIIGALTWSSSVNTMKFRKFRRYY